MNLLLHTLRISGTSKNKPILYVGKDMKQLELPPSTGWQRKAAQLPWSTNASVL